MKKKPTTTKPKTVTKKKASGGRTAMPCSEVALEIVLRGGPLAGKSEVMRIIDEALNAHGINVECYMAKRTKQRRVRGFRPAGGPYDARRVAMIEEWGTRIPKYPQNAAAVATGPQDSEPN